MKRSHNYPPDLILEKAHRQGVENQQRLDPIPLAEHLISGYVSYDMAIAFENDQITHDELFEEADRNKQIKEYTGVIPRTVPLCPYCVVPGRNAYAGCIGIPGCPNV